MKKKETKKVYKTNKKLLKRVLTLSLIIFVVILLAFPMKYMVQTLYYNSYKEYNITPYEFSINVPRAFKELDSASEDIYGINSAGFKSEFDVDVDEKYISKRPEVVYSGANVLNGVSLMVQAISTSGKTTKTLDEIAESNHILITIYYEDNYKIDELRKEYLTILETNAVKSVVDITNDEESKTFVTYLVPMEDKEITITFLGGSERVLNYMSEMDEIVKKIK